MSEQKSLNTIPTAKQLSEYNKEIEMIRSKTIKAKIQKPEVQIQRLTNEVFYNPYDVLLLQSSATDDDIKRQFRAFALMLHPDRCKDPRAKDAWQSVEQAYKTLNDPDKRKVYLRIMRQARERAEFERDRENKKRVKNGQMPLPQSTFQDQYQQICQNIFKQLQQKKDHIIKIQQSSYNRKIQQMQTKKIIEQFRILTEQQWQRSRQKRVSNWRDFSKKKFIVGSKKSDGAIRPPPVKQEDRPHYAVVEDKKKNL